MHGPRRHAATTSMGWSLAALLDERLHEVLGVGLEHLVDLVEDRVDVLVDHLLALGHVRLGHLLGDLLGLRRPARLLLLLGHGSTLSTPSDATRAFAVGGPGESRRRAHPRGCFQRVIAATSACAVALRSISSPT